MAKYFTVMAYFELLLVKHLLLNFREIFDLAHLLLDALHYLFVIISLFTVGKIFLNKL